MRIFVSATLAIIAACGSSAQPAFDPSKGVDDRGFPLIPPAELLKPFVTPPYDNPILSAIKGPKVDRYDGGIGGEEEEEEHEYGPPPFGDPDIFGEPMPDAARTLTRSGAPLVWEFVGPEPILDEYWSGNAPATGRVVGIAPHPTIANICYIAAASGGLWSTINGGQTWTPLSATMNTHNCGAIALDPTNPNILYLGTGEYQTGSPGDGLYRVDINAGTWVRIGTASQVGNSISGIAVDPLDPQVIHVTGTRGYVRTTNGGATWTLGISGSCSSLALNTTDPNIVYAARNGDAIYRSPNKGQNFTKRNTGIDNTPVRRIVIAISKTSPSTLYAAFVDSSNGLQGFYSTNTEGDTWTKKAGTPDFPYPQGSYDLFVGVDPTNANRVFAGGVDPRYADAGVIRSIDGGNTWDEISAGPAGGQLHPDHHVIAFGPGVIWEGSDGGIQKSLDGGESWINLNNTLAITQNVQLALNPIDSEMMATGTQDNGTIGRIQGDNKWNGLVSGDGGFLAFDHEDPSIFYSTYVYLTTFRITDTTFDDITGPWDGDLRRFYSPLVMDPNNAKILCGGTTRVWRTTDATAASVSWTPLSSDLFGGSGTLNAIAIAKGDSNTIYAGGSNGRIFVTNNLTTWNERSSGVPNNTVMDIVIDPTNPAIAYAAFAATGAVPRVMRTVDSGETWTDLSGDLPVGAGARSLAVYFKSNPPKIIMGSGAGYYISDDDGVTWTHNGTEFPNVQLADLRIDEENDVLVAGTYGRGVWRTPLKCISDIDQNGEVDLSDFFGFFNFWDVSDPAIDFNADGSVDLLDYFRFLNGWDKGC